ncbi:ribosomal RNA small subunit methyltransferase B [Insulibacter thermoxylanivorax]|uniref:16S rRNA (cytosine(967)-C(5))-methyltransferase n=1 Tax=Insulibacter thermoxylanivorax TaxID=2749268 RepID=A0A916QG42_9BACL|nr:16S rRNA (cytosine(967)-C(5))-methyltransferase RsmB [Insulibacter thermoxylanivorax]GFR37797.1 ribosomal RNA small subunit methyltransferase B [Insulibacter thermoxylanivorax]
MSGRARSTALDILLKIERDQAYSNLELNQALKAGKLNQQDAALVTEIVYGTIQRQNTIDYYLSRFVARGLDKVEPWVRILLRLSFYQIYYLDRIPPHAAVNEAVNIAKKRGHKGIAGMVNGVLRSVLRSLHTLQIPDSLPPAKRISLVHSHPEWLVQRWIEQYGAEETEAMCEANNQPAPISVRVNRLKTDRDAMLAALREHGFDARPSLLSEDGIVLAGRRGNIAHTDWYEQGLLTIQDESSMVVARMLDAQPGMRVLDCCAAPGGKTTHIAETMGDEGEIWANDIHEHKQALIEAQVRRLGLSSVRTRVGDAANLAEEFPAEHFDRILLDAPCSGLGVIRRKPDIKWRKSSEEIAELANLQLHLLIQAAKLLKRGGILVYSTCTVDPAENEQVIRRFLADHPEFTADEQADLLPPALSPNAEHQLGAVRILPHHYGSDGFFIARLRRA